MNLETEKLFWQAVHFLIVKKHYRILQISKNHQEVWLEKTENKESPIIRLLHTDLDWSNRLKTDIEMVALNGERLRKRLVRGQLNITNIYFVPLPPVDDYEHLLTNPYIPAGKRKIKVTSFIVDEAKRHISLNHLRSVFGKELVFDENLNNDIEIEIHRLRHEAISIAATRAKAEESVFESGKPLLTYFFIIVQVIIFALMELQGGSTQTSTLIQFGAKFNPLIIEGEWWRFLTPMFLHIGFLHLLMNSMALYYLGPLVERIYGNIRFLFIYIFAGFAGVLGSFIFSTNLSAGASGAIFGCFGALLYFGVVFPRLFFRTLGVNILIVLAINLMFGFTVPGIDNAGHIGGLIGGFAAAGILRFPKKRKYGTQILYFVGTAVIVMAMLQYGFSGSASVVDKQSIIILAQDYIQGEEYDKAHKVLSEFHEVEEDSTEILFLLSFTEIKRNNLDDAKDQLHRVIELDPNFHEAHYNLALVYLEENSLENAKTYAENAVKIEPKRDDYQELVENIDAFIQVNQGN
ncbi:rhomboid family intramembrane serine protease [Mesobacillus maritimus]|uniref:rhomboid family intramembrane serine protease n=1 Tax=Mesobacillus maritimus TaxID=1643336 RepID=UPI00203DC53E|nr:rhomboid family intramembrane serine protease [Mesobacillus maritimus]MCM3586336.1 rhomboid family intramembrane serine protease [Mesobacillus maritimus]